MKWFLLVTLMAKLTLWEKDRSENIPSILLSLVVDHIITANSKMLNFSKAKEALLAESTSRIFHGMPKKGLSPALCHSEIGRECQFFLK